MDTHTILSMAAHGRTVDTLSRLGGCHDLSKAESGGAAEMIDAATTAESAFRSADYALDVLRRLARGGDTQARERAETVEAASHALYAVWQALETVGLPLVQTAQRDGLGYAEEEVAAATPRRAQKALGMDGTL